MKRSLCLIRLASACALAASVLIPNAYGQPFNKGASSKAAVVGGTATAVPFDSDRWVMIGSGVRKEEYLGRKSMFLSGGTFAHLRDVEFEDGTIEVDVAASTARAFFGVVFRFKSRDEHEVFYMRSHKSGQPDATQYTPSFNGSHPWQFYSGPGFTAAAEIPRDRWMHVKIEIAGLSGRVYLNQSTDPVLVINDLKRGYGAGSVGLYSSGLGAHFSDFKFTALKPSDSRPPHKLPAQAPGILANWELSEAFDTGENRLEALPAASEMKAIRWQAVKAEPPGMVVIDRYRRSPNLVPAFATDPALRLQKARGPKAIYARTTIYSDRDQVKRLSFGYSDEITLFLNGQSLFTGKSAYRFRDPGFLGIVDVENDAVYLPLKKGSNELVLAVSEYFGGWGFICRFEDRAGVKID
jgi:hypothetical protein